MGELWLESVGGGAAHSSESFVGSLQCVMLSSGDLSVALGLIGRDDSAVGGLHSALSFHRSFTVSL